jgi:hypothetical protein
MINKRSLRKHEVRVALDSERLDPAIYQRHRKGSLLQINFMTTEIGRKRTKDSYVCHHGISIEEAKEYHR